MINDKYKKKILTLLNLSSSAKIIAISLITYHLSFNIYAQDVYVHHQNVEIYNFIDEMANEGLIEINDLVKPYSRNFIAQKLAEVDSKRELINHRQQKELDFYLKDYNKELKPDKRSFKKRLDLFFYKDSLFSFTVNPIGGIQYWTNDSLSTFHRWSGAEAFATVGKNFGFYASLRDNHESTFLGKEEYLVPRMGGNYKYVGDGGDFSEMRGGITYSWKWGSVGLLKDNTKWGYGYNGTAILGGQSPSYAHLSLKLNPVKWFKFNYIHGWLVSEVVDSSNSFNYVNSYGTGRRDALVNKYIAANMFTFTPWSGFDVSFGNSVIYSLPNVHPAYLLPLMFYKSIDHTLNSTDQAGTNVGQNSQMFFAASLRRIKHLHLYSTFFLDEIAIGRMTDPVSHSNFYSLKAGAKVSNWPVRNTSLTVEFTRTNPLTFQHNIPVTTFETNGYNLGHYLKDNSQELYVALQIRPLRGLLIDLSYLDAKRGPDYTELGTNRLGLPFIETVEWKNKTFKARFLYQIINDGFVFMEFIKSNVSGAKAEVYTPQLFQGNQFTVSMGLNFGF